MINTAGRFYEAVIALGREPIATAPVPWAALTGPVEVWRTAPVAAVQALLDRIPAAASVTLVTQPDDAAAYHRPGLAVERFPRPGFLAAEAATLAWASSRRVETLLIPVNRSDEEGYDALKPLGLRRGGAIWLVYGERGRKLAGRGWRREQARRRLGDRLAPLLDAWRRHEEAAVRSEIAAAEAADPDAVLERSYERVRPLWQWSVLFQEHRARYLRATAGGRGKRVLDLGCGEGYGAAQLATVARTVVAVDVHPRAVRFAARKYRREKLIFVCADARRLPFKPGVFEQIVSFEVIEHLPEPDGFLAETGRILDPAGELVFSTPNRRTYPAGNIFHPREYTLAELNRILPRHFRITEIIGQAGNERLREWDAALADRSGMLAAYRAAARRFGWSLPDEEITTGVIRRAHTALTGFDESTITADDFTFSADRLDAAEYFFLTCRGPR